jgi:ABC-type sulfate transport system permease component
MRGTVAVSDIVAWPFLLPGELACRALGLAKSPDRSHDLVRMLINSLVWTTLGVVVAVFAT